jgi:hypothetical protein
MSALRRQSALTTGSPSAVKVQGTQRVSFGPVSVSSLFQASSEKVT